MPTYEKLRGQIAIASNSPGMPTGYGQQTEYLVDRLVRHGLDVAVFSNYGLEGEIVTRKTPNGSYKVYPRGWAPHSQDVLTPWFREFTAGKSNPARLLTLYDVWVYNDAPIEADVLAWVPLDHVTLPPMVGQFLRRDNVSAIAMSPHGQRQLEQEEIPSKYIPHGIDTTVFKPTKNMRGKSFRDWIDVDSNTFLVTIVSANKADRVLHRKALAEQILAFSMFVQKYPNSFLYLHMDATPAIGGFDIAALLKATGVPKSKVAVADRDQLRIGYDRKDLAAIYSASDVLLCVSMGEGFGIPTVEAQACGTRVITSSWAASQDLAGPDSFLVEGQPFWHDLQSAWFQIPLVSSIVAALEKAYESERGMSESSIEFAQQFDVNRVWVSNWMPMLREIYEGQ